MESILNTANEMDNLSEGDIIIPQRNVGRAAVHANELD